MQVQLASQNEIAGVDIWSLNDDDSYNICRKKPFPLTNEIAAYLKGERKTFNSFTDLDIVLSTGESQLDEIQVLQEPNTDPEEIRKFKCERIGFYRHPSDCSKFYHCAEHRATSSQPSSQYAVFVYRCPSGLVYDELQGSCNWPSYSEPCQGSDELLPVPSKKFQCTIPGFHVDPEDCRWFYYCSDLGDGRLAAFEFLCPSHLLGFDEQQLLCNWKWMVPTCTNSHYTERENEATTYTESTDKFMDSRNISEINNTQYLKNTVSPLLTTWNLFPDIGNVEPIALNLKLENSKDPLKHRIPVNSFLTEDEVKNKNSLATYNNVTKVIEKTIDTSKINGTINNVKNNNEKKYGTAVWHRSMITNKSPDNHQRSRFDAFLERIHDLRLSNNTSESSKRSKPDEEIKVDHRYGVGTVRKINSPLLQDKSGKDTFSENYQGRSLGGSISSSYHFENTLNDHESTIQPKPYAQVKCSKINNKNKITDANANENSFGCIGEVSLTVNIKEGKENDRYIIKPDQITSSAIQESEQIAVLSNNTANTSTLKLQRLQLKSFGKETLQDHNNSELGSTGNLENFNTEGRIASIEGNTFALPQINANNEPPNINTFRNEQGISLTVENPITHNNAFAEKLLFERNENSNIESHLPKNGKTNNVTLVRVPRTKHLEESVKEKNNLMPLVFFPEGVLLNVDLNQINEIPPQILLEVDIMLKKYMSDGNIDLHVLMQKLNATAEPMSNIGNRNGITNNEIDDMLGVLENLLNSTNSVDVNHKHNITLMNNNTGNSNSSFILSTIENYTDQNDVQLQYENVTNIIGMSGNSKETEKSINSTEAFNTTKKNNSDMPDIKKIAEKILDVPESKPFIRRRLFRKHKFPSIREQLEFQSRAAYNRNLENPSYSTTTTTATSVSMTNRNRYPSIRQQLFLNNKRKSSLNARNNVIWKRLQEMHSEIVSNKNDSNTPVQLSKSDNKDDISLKGNRLEDGEPFLKHNPLENRDILLKARKLGNNDIHLITHKLGEDDTQSKTHQFGDRIRPNDFDLYFNSNPKTSTLDLELPYHKNPNLENRNDLSFVSNDRSNPKLPDESIIVTMDFTSNADLEEDNIPSIHNGIPSHRKHLQEERFKYTLPLSPVLRTNYYPPPQSTTPISDSNQLHKVSSESTESDYPNTNTDTSKRPRKSRKLRILVKKRFHNTQNNDGNSETAREDVSKIDHHQHMRMKIPKKLLSELKSNVLRKLALNGKSEVKLQIQFQDHVWNVPFVNEKSSVDISPVACTRPGLFQHPKDCNMFYECFWDKWLQRFTLHVFSCPVRLVYDDSIRGCSRPSFESHCRNSVNDY